MQHYHRCSNPPRRPAFRRRGVVWAARPTAPCPTTEAAAGGAAVRSADSRQPAPGGAGTLATCGQGSRGT
jgi:hypothetical protein